MNSGIRFWSTVREHRGEELDRVVHLEPGSPVGQHGVPVGVRLAEGVLGELRHLLPQVLGSQPVHAVGDAPLDELPASGDDEFDLLLAEDLADLVGLVGVVPGQQHAGLHDLLLVEDAAVGGGEHLLQPGVRDGDLGVACPALQVQLGQPGVLGAGPDQGEHVGELGHVLRPDLLAHPDAGAGLDLEDTQGLAVATGCPRPGGRSTRPPRCRGRPGSPDAPRSGPGRPGWCPGCAG